MIDWFEHDDIVSFRPFIPQFEFLFFNIASHDQPLVDTMKLKAYLEIIRSMYMEDLEELYRVIVELDRAKKLNYFETVLLYVFNVTESVSEDGLKERLTMEGRKKLMAIAEKLRQESGMEGRMEGKEEGKIETLKDIFQNML